MRYRDDRIHLLASDKTQQKMNKSEFVGLVDVATGKDGESVENRKKLVSKNVFCGNRWVSPSPFRNPGKHKGT